TGEEVWDIRNRGVIPPGALPRVRAFADVADPTGADDESGLGEGSERN
ncbi:MAG: hypothetical protein ACRDU0_10280, partial [Mycobacterium sp.]